MAGSVFSQQPGDCKIQFEPQFNSERLKPGYFYNLQNGDSLQITTLKFYVSGIELLWDSKIVYKESNSYHLIDASENSSMLISLAGTASIKYNQIQFCIGIDSLTNFSGARGGHLDPTQGMYWTWQNGYINFKMEGRSNKCNSHNNEFQFHLGGFQYPFNSLQPVTLKVTQKELITIELDIEKLISEINFTENDHIMSPGKEAMVLAGKLPKICSITEN
ncbi:MAG TPA: hypothetical protein PKD91_00215 [Bacteroidia bacterium]|nr:hypothetical protein [Bacteroidia bacterium]